MLNVKQLKRKSSLPVLVELEEEPPALQTTFIEVCEAVDFCLKNATREGLVHQHVHGVMNYG